MPASSALPDPPAPPSRGRRLFGEFWRVAFAVLAGLVFFAFRLVDVEESVGGPDAVILGSGELISVLLLVDLLLGVVAVVLMLLRRRWPLIIALVTSSFSAASVAAAPAAVVCLASLAKRRRRSDLYAVLPVFVVAALLPELFAPSGDGAWRWGVAVAVSLLVFAAVWSFGAYTGARRDLLASVHERAVAAVREQELRVAQARTSERARIAQEMHDILAHRISLIAVHANALAYRGDLSREQMAEHAGIVRDNADRAVAELAGVLGVLRGGEGADNTAPPQPTLDALADLVQETQRAGTPVAIVGAMPDLDDLPVVTSRTAYRIVQECLTNARKHAAGLPVTVAIGGAEGARLDIVVKNPLASGAGDVVAAEGPGLDAAAGEPVISGAGMGLIGLAERAELAGGTFESGTEAGFFVVRAELPWGAP